MKGLVLTFWLLRVIWTCLPQTGYIHPDEFFQSTEIISGDILDLETTRTWEFNSTQPIRSVVPLYTFLSPCLLMLKFTHQLPVMQDYLSGSYVLLILPRLSLVIISLLIDFIVMDTSKKLKLNQRTVFAVYASSYVVNVFFTRTLSNTIESFLFMILLNLVISGVEIKASVISRKKKSERSVDDAAAANLPTFPSVTSGFLIGFIIVFGFFNRPTFFVFALIPLVVWVTNKLEYLQDISWQSLLLLGRRAIDVLVGAVFCFVYIIIIDSVYYGTLDFKKIFVKDANLLEIANNVTVTPLNFIRYNSKLKNLSDHGIHPWFTHFLVNSFLLFGHLAFFAMYRTTFNFIKYFVFHKTPSNSQEWMLLSYLFPISMLSFFPHQEPRFLLPLIFPLIFTVAECIYGTHWSITVNWVIFNLLGCLVFGILHQGGVIPCLSYLQKTHNNSAYRMNHIVFYHTYMPPKHLLRIPKLSSHPNKDDPSLLTKSLTLHDLKGSSTKVLYSHIQMIIDSHVQDSSDFTIWVASPASLDWIFCKKKSDFKFELDTYFGLHLSLEDLPNGDLSCTKTESCNLPCKDRTSFSFFYQLFSLHLYKVSI